MSRLYDYIIDKVIRCITLAPLMCMMLLLSCASPRNTDTESNKDYTEMLNGIRSSITGLENKIDTQSKTTSEKLSNMKIENKTVYLSPPDSTGKQHPTMESTTTATKTDEQKDETVIQTTELLSAINERIDSLSRKIDSSSRTEVIVKEISFRDKVSWFASGLLSAALLAAGIWIYYRFKK